MKPKPAKSMLMALALGKPKAGAAADDDDDEPAADMGGGAKMTAAKDALAAFKSGDASALSQALTDHYDACAAGGDEEEDEAADEEI